MKNITKTYFIGMIFLTVLSSSAFSDGGENKQAKTKMFTGLQTEAAAAVVAFNKALRTGDVKTARALLSDNVLILEGKNVERSAEQYASHHMLSDMKYLKAMKIETLEHHVTEYDEVAVSVSRSTVKGIYKDKTVDRQGNETITLEKQGAEWKIIQIHWSN